MILVDQSGENVDVNPKRNDASRHYGRLGGEVDDIFDQELNDELENHERGGDDDNVSLPALGLNYLNNLNLNLNLNLKLKNTSLWKIYENNFIRSAYGKHGSAGGINVDALAADPKPWFEWLDFKSELLGPGGALETLRITSPNNLEPVKYDDSLSVTSDKDSDAGCETASEIDVDEFLSSFKSGVNEDQGSGLAKPPLNPFYHRLHLTLYDKIKIGLCSVILLPIRAIGMFFFLCMAWALASIGTYGLTFDDIVARPLSPWRRSVRWFIATFVMRALFFCAGFHWVKFKGKKASREEAPILVVASHSSLFDALPLVMLGGPSVVAKSSVRDVTFFGKLVDLTQPVYVNRESANSRQATMREIAKRAQSKEEFPQIFVFPEGTCTNRSSLITFKPGAFIPGVPVQPVLLRYPNRCDSISWTFDGISGLISTWMTLSQFTNYLEVEVLPVVTPTEEEKQNADLFARRVQQIMAKALGVPAVEFGLEDGFVLEKMRGTPLRERLETVWNLRQELKLDDEISMAETFTRMKGQEESWLLSLEQFASLIGHDHEKPEVQQLFQVFQQTSNDLMNLREYILYSCLLHPHVLVEKVASAVFMMYGSGTKSMTKESFITFMQTLFFADQETCETVFAKGAKLASESITLDEFKHILRKRLEFAKLFAMEVNGELEGEYPPKVVTSKAKSKTD